MLGATPRDFLQVKMNPNDFNNAVCLLVCRCLSSSSPHELSRQVFMSSLSLEPPTERDTRARDVLSIHGQNYSVDTLFKLHNFVVEIKSERKTFFPIILSGASVWTFCILLFLHFPIRSRGWVRTETLADQEIDFWWNQKPGKWFGIIIGNYEAWKKFL